MKGIYLDQANRLSIILSEMTRYKDDAKAYRKKIFDLRMKPMNLTSRSQNEPPETPKRNIQEPLFSGNLKDRFTRQFSEIMKLPKKEQSQSSHEDHTNKVMTTAAPEIRLTNKEKAQEDTASAIIKEDEGPYTRKLILKDQGDDSASTTVQKVNSLTDNKLNGTETFI